MKGIGVIQNSFPEPGQHHVKLVRSLNEKEYLEYGRAIDKVSKLTANRPLLLVEKNRRRLRAISSFYRNAIALKRRSEHFDARGAIEAITFDTLNWLTATRLFLDHHRAAFSEDYGTDSEAFARLTTEISRQYDDSLAYRVLYKLRNFVQHKGFPPASVTVTAVAPESDDWSAIVEFSVSRKELLESGFEWGVQVRKDLRTLPERIDILALIEQASPCFRSIFAEIMRVRLENVGGAIAAVKELIAICDNDDGDPHLLDYGPDDDPDQGIKIRVVPHTLVAWLDNPQNSESYVDRLIEKRVDVSEMAAPDELDPSIQEHLRVGAGILNLFYEAHGDGAFFGDGVNRIADDLDDISPLILGLTETAAVALAMAAAALGTDARDLLGGMVSPATLGR